MTVKKGFHTRLRDALRASGLETEEDSAHALGITRRKIRRLLKMDLAWNVDAPTLFRICDVTGFSGRWLVRAELPVSVRIPVNDDENWLLRRYRALCDEDRLTLKTMMRSLRTNA